MAFGAPGTLLNEITGTKSLDLLSSSRRQMSIICNILDQDIKGREVSNIYTHQSRWSRGGILTQASHTCSEPANSGLTHRVDPWLCSPHGCPSKGGSWQRLCGKAGDGGKICSSESPHWQIRKHWSSFFHSKGNPSKKGLVSQSQLQKYRSAIRGEAGMCRNLNDMSSYSQDFFF